MKIRQILASLCLAAMMIATPAVAAGDMVDINTATVEQLQAVSGIGEKIAAEIVAYRNAHGVFQSVDDLVNVKGIGEKKLELIKSTLEVGVDTGDVDSAD